MSSNASKMVLHVGLMKTGTTYLQYILQNNRDALLSQQWSYPGSRENQQFALYNICGKNIPWVTDMAIGNYAKIGAQLVEATKARDKNLIISSEALSSLDADGIKHLVDQIGMPDKVVFSIRSLQKLFPSAWQQELKSGTEVKIDEYFNRALENRGNADPTGFWRNYGYGQIVKTWKATLPCQVDAVIVPTSSQDPDLFWQRFRQATGLPDLPNTLVPSDSSNASLSEELAEILYLFNRDFNQSNDLESLRKRTDFLKKCIFPVARNKAGNPIIIGPEKKEILNLWNTEERDHLFASADRVIGDISEL